MKQQAKKQDNLLVDPKLNDLFEVDILSSESEEDLTEHQKSEKMVYALLNNGNVYAFQLMPEAKMLSENISPDH